MKISSGTPNIPRCHSAVPGQISTLHPRIRPAVDLTGPNIEAAAKANARGLVKENKIKVVAVTTVD
jgi:hypothetical protein